MVNPELDNYVEPPLDRLARLDLEGRRAKALELLNGDPDVRVLKRLVPRPHYHERPPGGLETRIGVILDLETTGLDVETDQVIELGMLRFEFDATGMVYSVLNAFGGFEQPTVPITAEITDLTGITEDDVLGRRIDDADVAGMVRDADLMIAYNADFDRRIAERRWPGAFERLPWACAYRQVPWKKYGVVGGKLVHVLHGLGLFHEAHRAVDDCYATLHALATAAREGPPEISALGPFDLYTAMGELLQSTRDGAYRVLAWDSPFEWKDRLKARGYQWRGQVPWFRDMNTAAEASGERDTLLGLGASPRPAIRRISSRDRYSVRADR